ncbi:MAG: translation initiation factor IF-3 [Clostridia bacterium]|nr:translation initiation factor IF-3 [Clostridia bacterium]
MVLYVGTKKKSDALTLRQTASSVNKSLRYSYAVIVFGCAKWGFRFAFLFCKNASNLEVAVIAAKNSSLINEEIKASEVRVIGADGNQLGVMKLSEALKLSNEAELDLVEIAPDSKPPVCKIMDYGKFRFEKEKREKEQRKKRQIIELKEIQLKCRIDTHDFNTKLNHTLKFLSQGNKVKVIVKFFGREMAHTELGAQLLDRFAEGCGEAAVIEKKPLLDGRNMTMILAPKKAK